VTDFRALCEELLDWAERTSSHYYKQPDVILRARAALAQPEPQGPSDEDLDALFTEVDQSGESESWRTYARAALARWGRPAIEPVPVSERLPGPEDCDEEGLCWWWDSDCRQTEAWCRGLSEYASGSYSHWLPHWALPVPGVEGADA
jgi:hypothetical protein